MEQGRKEGRRGVWGKMNISTCYVPGKCLLHFIWSFMGKLLIKGTVFPII